MSVEVLLYPDITVYREGLPDILIELQDWYVGYLFLFSGQDKDYLEYLSYGLTPVIGFIFKKPNTLIDYLIIIPKYIIKNPRIYQNDYSDIDRKKDFAGFFNLLEYLEKVESNGETKVVNPIVYLDQAELGEDYKYYRDKLDAEDLSKSLNLKLLKRLPVPLLNPSWRRDKPLFDSATQIIEIMSTKTDIYSLLEQGCYGLSKEINSQTFSVWVTGEDEPSTFTFLEMAKKLRIFLDRVNRSQSNKHLNFLDTVYSALYSCLTEDQYCKGAMEAALILSDAQDYSRIEIIPSGWNQDQYMPRLPNTESVLKKDIEHDGSVFKLFQY